MNKRASLAIGATSADRCWGCGCTEADACVDPETGLGCAWVSEARNFCSNCALLYASLVVRLVQVEEAA